MHGYHFRVVLKYCYSLTSTHRVASKALKSFPYIDKLKNIFYVIQI